MNRPFGRLVAILAAALVLGACGPASTASPRPSGSPDVTATPSIVPSLAPSASATGSSAPSSSGSSASPVPSPTPPPFTLTSAAFHLDGVIPTRFTCDGRNVSPAVAWTGVPQGTGWLVLLMDDLDAHDFAHWIAYAIPVATSRLDEGAGAPRSTRLVQGTNDFGHIGYGGPCPPSGTHHYRFTLYALAAPLGLRGSPRADAVRKALGAADVLGTATLTAVYTR